MNPRLARWLTRLYPPAWRERYGEEFEELLETDPTDLRTVANSLWSAVCEHISPTQGGSVDQDPKSIAANDRKRQVASISGALLLSSAFLWLFFVFWTSRNPWRRWIDDTVMAATVFLVLVSVIRNYLLKRRS